MCLHSKLLDSTPIRLDMTDKKFDQLFGHYVYIVTESLQLKHRCKFKIRNV